MMMMQHNIIHITDLVMSVLGHALENCSERSVSAAWHWGLCNGSCLLLTMFLPHKKLVKGNQKKSKTCSIRVLNWIGSFFGRPKSETSQKLRIEIRYGSDKCKQGIYKQKNRMQRSCLIAE